MYRKKLIEVALPLEAINKASAKEKSIRHGHPSTLHLWWARRPLAACRAVLFASLVDDPSGHSEQFHTEVEQQKERERLFDIIERLVIWENVSNNAVFDEAKAEIAKSTGDSPPVVYDPFCGGGSIPLEAQRLGLHAYGSDLNPIAVLITKALIEIPREFANQAPINPDARKRGLKDGAFPGSLGLAADVRFYGNWMRTRAFERIGSLYPMLTMSDGSPATIIAWIWARTVQCPNPACRSSMLLVRSFSLSTKKGNETWVQPEIDHAAKTISFRIVSGAGQAPASPKTGRGANFRCVFCDQIAPESYIKGEAQEGRMGSRLMAVVADSHNKRIYLEPTAEQELLAQTAKPEWGPDVEMSTNPRWFSPPAFGLRRFRDVFTNRQLVALTSYCDLVNEARAQAVTDGASQEYANAVATYLAFGLDKLGDTNCTLCSWQIDPPRLRATFGRQALPMTWDFAEANTFGDAAGDYQRCIGAICEVLERLPNGLSASVQQIDAASKAPVPAGVMVSTDPPYYDNIGYADLSDFFYVWLRRSLFAVYPELLSTLLVPKEQELIATPHRFGGDKEKAQMFFESGFGRSMERLRAGQNASFPMTIFYAFKQSDSESDSEENEETTVSSTGWETMLEGLLQARFQITGTWPMRSELATRNVSRDTNALASSIVLVCRPRNDSAPLTTRKDFIFALKRELGPTIRTLQQGNIAPVDLQQAAIGPGMSIFSRHSKVVESDGSNMRVRTALGLINQALDEVLSEQESDYDPETRWALTWFEQNQFNEGAFGDANTLANAKALSVEGLQHAGIVQARAGKVRLLKREELQAGWVAGSDKHLTVWKVTQQLIHRLATDGQEAAQGVAAEIGGMADVARELAYRLYTLCERKGWAEEAGYYNALVVAWPAIRSQEFTLTGEK
jgi:putative DNA methylase